jgi:hypothetical protein
VSTPIQIGIWEREVRLLISDVGTQVMLGIPFEESIVITWQDWKTGRFILKDSANSEQGFTRNLGCFQTFKK